MQSVCLSREWQRQKIWDFETCIVPKVCDMVKGIQEIQLLGVGNISDADQPPVKNRRKTDFK